VRLRDSTGNVIDKVGGGSGAGDCEGSPVGDLAEGESLERKAVDTSTAVSMASGGTDALKGNGQDTGNNNADFVLRTSPDPQNSSSPLEPVLSAVGIDDDYASGDCGEHTHPIRRV
jgi:hypothetical protein